jgi:hypothetical protein
MAVTAEIKTGKRRVMEHFLSPLIKYGGEFRERRGRLPSHTSPSIQESTHGSASTDLDWAARLGKPDEKNDGKHLDRCAGLEIPSRCAFRNPTRRALLKNNRNNRDTRGRQHIED